MPVLACRSGLLTTVSGSSSITLGRAVGRSLGEEGSVAGLDGMSMSIRIDDRRLICRLNGRTGISCMFSTVDKRRIRGGVGRSNDQDAVKSNASA